MLAAMMAGGRRFANRHDLLAGTLTVPAGVTSLNIVAAARGGDAGPNIVGGTHGGGGGGGGGAILNGALAVAPGDVVSVALVLSPTRWELRVNGGPIQATVVAGENASGFSDFRGAAGGAATLGGTTASGGGQQSASAGAKGNAGAVVAVGGGTLIGGAGGGAGNTISPSLTGGAGGDVGALFGVAATTHWGGGGAGYVAGASRLTSSTTSDPGATVFVVEY